MSFGHIFKPKSKKDRLPISVNYSPNLLQTCILLILFIVISTHLSGIFLAYITALLFGVFRLTSEVCVMHRLGPPAATSLIFVSLAVKTIRLFRIFRAGVRTVQRPRFISPRSQVILTLVITALPVSVKPGGYSDLSWTGVCCSSLKTPIHL